MLPNRINDRGRVKGYMSHLKYLLFLSGIFPCFLLASCSSEGERSLVVTVTAYNSVPEQTDSTPNQTYWDDILIPGMKAIAVSPDLIKRGLTHGVKVRIEGLSGKYAVLDRTNPRFKKRIDIYMGIDVKKALKWGKQKRRIYWTKPKKEK